jgi:hypothetical protein
MGNGLIAVLLALVLTGCGSRVDLGSLTRQIVGASAPSAAAVGASDQAAASTAIQQTIERANQAQMKAFNTGDPTPMRDTATAGFYTQLMQTNRDLASSGVRQIELMSTQVSGVSVSGATATATTLETWRSTYTDGSTDQATARNDYTLVLDGTAWKIATDAQPAAAVQPAPQTPVDTGTPAAAAVSASTSTNWSGYSATGGSFTSVTGTWTVPTVSASITGADATWVGIGGIHSSDLIQAGTQATVSGGEVAYDAWIEMLPASSKTVSLTVSPGDSVTVSITQKSADAGQLWAISMKNNTTGGAYSTTVQYRSSSSSAEWVQEAPSVNRGTVPLDDFGTVKFSGATAVRDGSTLTLSGLGAQAITMVSGTREALAVPSAIAIDGSSFSVTRTQAASTSSGGTGRRRRG